jgi:hypothetical protein
MTLPDSRRPDQIVLPSGGMMSKEIMPNDEPAVKRWRTAIVTTALLFCGLKVAVSWKTGGSTDALLWQANLQALKQNGAAALYRSGTILVDEAGPYHREVFNHPPFMTHLLAWWGVLAESTHLPLRFWMRFTCASADLCSVMLLLAMMRRREVRWQPGSLLLVAASPVSLMLSGFHGNTDPIMVALLLLSIYLLGTGPAVLAGASLGMAVNIKIVPLLFAPAMFLALRGRARIEFAVGAAGAFVVGSLPLIVQYPSLIARNVFGYSPQSGMWGVPAIIGILGLPEMEALYTQAARFGVVAAMVAAAVWMNRGDRRTAALAQCGFLAFLLLSSTPGFGVQYLAWVAPFTCLLRAREGAAFHLAGGVFLVSYYVRAGAGYPDYLANSAENPVWDLSMILIGLVCWAAISFLGIRVYAKLQEVH